MGKVVYAFTPSEAEQVQVMLSQLAGALRIVPGGGKLEEGHWTYIYHQVRHAPLGGWSNLPMRDYSYAGLGVEMKVLGNRHPAQAQGKSVMHPAASRSIRFIPSDGAEACTVQVLEQFGAHIKAFRQRVAVESPNGRADIRWGILLWSPTLDEFLYFEEEMEEPNPANYRGEFVTSTHRGRPTQNLHIIQQIFEYQRILNYDARARRQGAALL